MKQGRPAFQWTEEIETALLEALVKGETLRAACKIAGLSYDPVYKRVDTDKDFAERYALAMERRWEQSGDQIIDILNQPIPDTIPIKGWNAWVNWQKNRADGLKWVAERAYPKRWGKRMDITSEGKAIEFKYPAPDVQRDNL